MKRKGWFFLGTLVFGMIIGVSLVVRFDVFTRANSQGVVAPVPDGSHMEDAVIQVAETTGKAVVSISTERTERVGSNFQRFQFGSPFGNRIPGGIDPFRSFFEDFFGGMPEQEYKQEGLGSGVIIDPDGNILTNEHVIRDADKITVTLPDGRVFKGEVKGTDPRSDLAVIKISAHNLPVAVLGDSSKLKIGQWVVAIGNPFGFAMENPEPTVTTGVISALHRSFGRALAIGRDKDYGDLIQTDAAINPGNSGGPLVNLKGEVVGINVAIFSTSGGYQGIGFAIPVNSAKRVISRLIEGKKILYGWLGVNVQDLNEELAKHFGLSGSKGALVVNVLPGGPAAKAGIKDQDVIISFAGQAIENVRDLLNTVGKAEVGSKVKVALIRNKKDISVDVVVAERPQNVEAIGAAAGAWRGIEVQDLTPEIASRLGITETAGAVVVNVKPGSQADKAGLVSGDVIIEIDRQPVGSAQDFRRIVSAIKGDCLIKAARGFFIIKAGE